MSGDFRLLRASLNPVGRSSHDQLLSPQQIKAARAMIDWRQRDLADASGMAEISVRRIECGATRAQMSTIIKIRIALERAGVSFVFAEDGEGLGVVLRHGTAASGFPKPNGLATNVIEAMDTAIPKDSRIVKNQT